MCGSTTTVRDLPVEIHTEILQHVANISQYDPEDSFLNRSRNSTKPIRWYEYDVGKPSQFPYNVADSLPVWFDIVATYPAYWTRVIIDISVDPKKYLGAFLWSKDLSGLSVTIFNGRSGMMDSTDVDAALERKRVSAVVDALLSHISRCESIVFDIIYSSSLPSPVPFFLADAPDLKKLAFECKIKDSLEDEEQFRSFGHDLDRLWAAHQTSASFSKPKELSMPGLWFFSIANDPNGLRFLKQATHKKSLVISHFVFQPHGHHSIRNFISLCLEITLCDLTLRNISLGYERASVQEGTPFEDTLLEDGAMTLENVSADFMASFFSLVDVYLDSLIIEKCPLPNEVLETSSCNLVLKHIPHNAVQISSGTTNLGLFLSGWSGWFLDLYSCPSFDDDLLSFLSTSRFQSDAINLHDCYSFTPHGVRKYIEKRNEFALLPQDSDEPRPFDYPLSWFQVYDRAPVLSAEDKQWFRTNACAEFVRVNWDYYTNNPESPIGTFRSRGL